jgi:putative endonuclease
MFYVYVLKSNKYNEMYVGSTSDLRRRFTEHNVGKVKSTKDKRPYKLIYYEAYGANFDARRREKMLKLRGQARRQLLSRLSATLAQNKS